MTTLRTILFAALLCWRFGFIWSEAPVVNFALRADWIDELAYLRGEGLLGIVYRPVRLLYHQDSPMRDAMMKWDRTWYEIWFGE